MWELVGSECGRCSALQHRVIGGTEMPHYTASRDNDGLWNWLRVRDGAVCVDQTVKLDPRAVEQGEHTQIFTATVWGWMVAARTVFDM